jgi:sugar phosphate isomerase/epimerase
MAVRLTYCGNVHAAEDLEAWLHGVARWSAPIGRAQPAGFGLGAWWNAGIAAELASSEAARVRVARELDRLQLTIATLNVFPYGDFHAPSVKLGVYRPDWTSEDRLIYTRDAAEAVAAVLRLQGQRPSLVPLSTLPLGYGDLDLRLAARNLARAASALAAIEERTGLRLLLALEPEPCCALETVSATAAFCEQWLLRPGAWTVPDDVIRRHVGLCVDLCHLAVVREDPLAAAACGLEIGKVQVSSCLELRDGRSLDRLLRFDEGRYLHQTVADSGARALDLGDVRARRAEFAQAGRLRTHFHVPVFWDEAGDLGSTRAEVERALRQWPRPMPLLEVETYTWGVLPRELAPADLASGIRAELAWTRNQLPA